MAVGDAVEEGGTIMVVEAMKMQNFTRTLRVLWPLRAALKPVACLTVARCGGRRCGEGRTRRGGLWPERG